MSSEAEVRYHGRLVATFDSTELAQAYVERRLAHELEGPAFDRAALTVAPRRPVSLFCRGTLVDTFHDEQDAHDRIAELVDTGARIGAEAPTAPVRAAQLSADDFRITTTP
jgi:hypothetical protein